MGSGYNQTKSFAFDAPADLFVFAESPYAPRSVTIQNEASLAMVTCDRMMSDKDLGGFKTTSDGTRSVVSGAANGLKLTDSGFELAAGFADINDTAGERLYVTIEG